MKLLYGLYTLINVTLVSAAVPPFMLFASKEGKYKKNFRERLGCVSQDILARINGSPRIWMHAVSLGEIRVAASITGELKKLLPECSIVVSTTTEHGRELAEKILDRSIPVIYGPVDYIFSVRKILKTIKPDVMAFLETEIWPAWITEARRYGIKTALVNGRISPRSFKQYLRFRAFFKDVLKNIDRFSMISEADKSRLAAIGADPSAMTVNGNAKYDLIIDNTDSGIKESTQRRLSLGSRGRVIIAGSTRTGEEIILLDAYMALVREFPDTVLVIAPRHLKRVKEVCALVEDRKLKYQFLSEIDGEKSLRKVSIIIVDTYGELFNIYSVGDIAFCGASLVPLGGQNPIEPAVWGVPVIYGPHMEDFMDAKAILEKFNGGAEVKGHEDIVEIISKLFKDPSCLEKMGENARNAIIKNSEASARHARVIAELAGN